MRDEISEPQHWHRGVGFPTSWSAHRHDQHHVVPLASAEVVDAAFAEELPESSANHDARLDPAQGIAATSVELVSTLSEQLALIESQRDRLRQLLERAQKSTA